MTTSTSQIPIRKITNTITDDIRNQAVFSISDGMEKLRPHYSLNVEKVYDQRLRRIVNRCARRTVDENGERIAFALPDQGIIVNINRCEDPELIEAVNQAMKKQLDGFKASVDRVAKRLKVLEGQVSIDDLLSEQAKEATP